MKIILNGFTLESKKEDIINISDKRIVLLIFSRKNRTKLLEAIQACPSIKTIGDKNHTLFDIEINNVVYEDVFYVKPIVILDGIANVQEIKLYRKEEAIENK